MNCPECNTPTFIHKEYETEEIDICTNCHGVWLDEGEILSIVKNKVTEFSEQEIKETVTNAFMGIPLSERESIKACPKCAVKMSPVNYSIDSGVIIDKCPSNHGVWLNHHELEKVQQYRDYWQEKSFQKQGEFAALVNSKYKPTKEETPPSFIFSIATVASEIFSKLFKDK